MADLIVKNGRVDDKETLLNDVSKAFKDGLFSDATFVTADGVSISTNRFMLACRVPYFATMLFGGFAENLENNPIPLKFCNSNVFQEILKFVFEGEISLSEMSLTLLLDFLETSRLFCVERLIDSITAHFEILLGENKIALPDCLVAFEFLLKHKFTAASELFLSYVDKNLYSLCDLEEFGNLTEFSLRKVLQNETRKSKEIVRFTAFTRWLNENESFPVNERIEILNSFNLRKFDDTELMNVVRKSNLFNEKDICDVLEEKLEAQKLLLETQKQLLEAQQQLLVREKERLNRLVQESEVVKFELVCVDRKLRLTSRSQFEFPSRYHDRYVNKVEFNHGFENEKYSYVLESSQDGFVWSAIGQRTKVEGGQHHICFERKKMKFISVKLVQPPFNDLASDIRDLIVRMV